LWGDLEPQDWPTEGQQQEVQVLEEEASQAFFQDLPLQIPSLQLQEQEVVQDLIQEVLGVGVDSHQDLLALEVNPKVEEARKLLEAQVLPM
jgi:hypothetical protein